MRPIRYLAAVLAVIVLALSGGAAHAATTTKTATFRANTPLYLPGPGTTGPFNKAVNGKLTFTAPAVAGGKITVTGTVRGLAPNTAYSTVAYKDRECLPTPGLTAFPSSAFTTNATGYAKVSVTVNPKALNPVGTLTVAQIASVSIRQVLINGVALPFTVSNNPYPATPTIPNVAYVEACDRAPVAG